MLTIGLIFCAITAYLAKRKGYNPIKQRQFAKLRMAVKKALCEAQAGKINLAIDEYYGWHIMNFNNGPHKPASIHDMDFINRFLNGKLPEHPQAIQYFYR